MRRDSSRLYLGGAFAAGLLTVFGLVADQVFDGDSADFDNWAVMLFRDPASPAMPIGPRWIFEAIRDLTALGSFSVLGVLVIGVVLHFLLTGAYRTGVLVAVSVLGGTILSQTLKSVFDRPRPDLAAAIDVFTSSFPSGHATISAVVYLTIGAILAERAKRWPARVFYIVGAAFLTVIIGASRVYLGVHFPTDVLAGWSLGAAWSLICLMVAHGLRMRGRLHDETPPGPST